MTTTLEAPATVYTSTAAAHRVKRQTSDALKSAIATSEVAHTPESVFSVLFTTKSTSLTKGRWIMGTLNILSTIWGILVVSKVVTLGEAHAMYNPLGFILTVLAFGFVGLSIAYMSLFKAGLIDGIFGEKN